MFCDDDLVYRKVLKHFSETGPEITIEDSCKVVGLDVNFFMFWVESDVDKAHRVAKLKYREIQETKLMHLKELKQR